MILGFIAALLGMACFYAALVIFKKAKRLSDQSSSDQNRDIIP